MGNNLSKHNQMAHNVTPGGTQRNHRVEEEIKEGERDAREGEVKGEKEEVKEE
jgi:hypothetical protein